jgi:hypothetical protein
MVRSEPARTRLAAVADNRSDSYGGCWESLRQVEPDPPAGGRPVPDHAQDHLVSLELEGALSGKANLWPEPDTVPDEGRQRRP